MKQPTSKHLTYASLVLLGGVSLAMFQNCGNPTSFGSDSSASTVSNSSTGIKTPVTTVPPAPTPKPPVVSTCAGISCELTPLTGKPAVTTILMALGDEANNQLVVSGASSQLIAESIVRFTSPQAKPKLLLVHDFNSGSESKMDFDYTIQLLKRYSVTVLQEPQSGLKAADLVGFDLVWLNNPGYPMNSKATRDALTAFKGGVVIEGDDMSQGSGFDNSSLTGLTFIDNGAQVTCAGKVYDHDNNGGEQYRVSLNPDKIPGADKSTTTFRYGNDIDNTKALRPDIEVLASAVGGPSSCTETRPAIVRYLK